MEQVVANLTGKSADLLAYEDVRRMLHAKRLSERTIRDIPLDAIIGSVGRYTDFTRTFLPKHGVSQERWAQVFSATHDLAGLPPIEVYQVGSAYFVKDGHHRVSVARQLDAPTIQAYVTRVKTSVPLTPETDVEDLLLKAEYADFLERTELNETRPEADLTLTEANYDALEEHIGVHRYFMGVAGEREVPYPEAAAHWYDVVYQPVVQAIRRLGMLKEFPHRTETDLYLWVMEHRSELEEELGWQVATERAARHLTEEFGEGMGGKVARVSSRIRAALTPTTFRSGPPPGQWRVEGGAETDHALFRDILVPIGGPDEGWEALEEALVFAQRDGGRLRGLHVVDDEEEVTGARAQQVRQGFEERCRAAGVEGQLVVEVGNVATTICDRARWVDLVALKLNHPPGRQPLARLSSGFRAVLSRCPRPVLAVPAASRPVNGALLAYDGSPKAREALYVATYLAGRWGLRLGVVTVLEDEGDLGEELLDAREYLKAHGVEATYISENGMVENVVTVLAEERDDDLILMGGYGLTPMLEVIVGSSVDEVLRRTSRPVLLCR
jgi:nucleotide-binding universal stress UspA family protein